MPTFAGAAKTRKTTFPVPKFIALGVGEFHQRRVTLSMSARNGCEGTGDRQVTMDQCFFLKSIIRRIGNNGCAFLVVIGKATLQQPLLPNYD